MKIKKIGLAIFILLIMYIPVWFIYTRFCLDKYEIEGLTLKRQSVVYVYKNSFFENDEQNIGRTIGIAFEGEKTWQDFVFPYWVMEYKNDKEHNLVFVRGLMDLGGIYEKVSE